MTDVSDRDYFHVDLLPRAARRPVRDRHALARLRGRRGPRAPRRGAAPAQAARAPARAARAHADARRQPARADASGRPMSALDLPRAARPPARPPGLLVLHHGRGADEHDLLGLADVLDPRAAAARRHAARAADAARLARATTGTSCRASATPTPTRSTPPTRALAAFHDELWERTGHRRRSATVFGGFSMGSVMSYALGLGADRPAPAGHPRLLRASSRSSRAGSPTSPTAPDLRVFIAHGRRDPVMEVGFARRARELLEAGGLDVEYHESDAGAPHRPGARPGRGRLAADYAALSGSRRRPD